MKFKSNNQFLEDMVNKEMLIKNELMLLIKERRIKKFKFVENNLVVYMNRLKQFIDFKKDLKDTKKIILKLSRKY